ncbi:MAG: 2-dehydropantoate 2-reductase [Halioglobus sp.]
MTNQAEPRWTVLGAGAIGCLFAYYLQRAGCSVTLLRRPGKPVSPLSLELAEATTTLQLQQATVEDCAPIDNLLITTKAYDVREALRSAQQKLQPDAAVIILANGMGLREEAREDFPSLPVYCATTTQGAHRVGVGRIRHAGEGATFIGGAGTMLPPPWFAPWEAGVRDCHWDADIDSALWQKLAINCAINPLTAVHRCLNGALAEQPGLAAQVDGLCTEISQVSYAAGYTATAQNIAQTAMEVIRATASNQSSMLQDVEAGRQTEIHYITGYLLTVADAHGIPAPINAALYEKVNSLGN